MAEETKIPAKFKDIVESVEKLNVLELSELVKIFEERFGVSAAMMVPQGGIQAAAQEGEAKAGGDEAALKTVTLKSAGEQKIQVIKVIREVLSLGLKEAKDMVDAAPKAVKSDLKPEEAEELKKKLEAAGATVEVK